MDEFPALKEAGIMTEQLTLTQTIDPLADAIAWRDENPEAFAYFVTVAYEDMERGFPPSSDYCGHRLRRSGLLTRRPGEPLLFNDHLTSSLARLCKRELGIPFKTREAAVDRWEQAS